MNLCIYNVTLTTVITSIDPLSPSSCSSCFCSCSSCCCGCSPIFLLSLAVILYRCPAVSLSSLLLSVSLYLILRTWIQCRIILSQVINLDDYISLISLSSGNSIDQYFHISFTNKLKHQTKAYRAIICYSSLFAWEHFMYFYRGQKKMAIFQVGKCHKRIPEKNSCRGNEKQGAPRLIDNRGGLN